ncbi:hypothetical protein PLESTB_000319700 [Pleodorina starrii]|uniref:Uncharacterized protein n=1 Tax=Pleodorina starrii TaxID=330485 RepID=A0A9W6EYD7_9CHLO|nr:hypothetical protein PLESTB_000319700 [Pleodorina starrii]GLC68242.1 hypothetical protein PLESTF_000665800 [Pleodorina starrii]
MRRSCATASSPELRTNSNQASGFRRPLLQGLDNECWRNCSGLRCPILLYASICVLLLAEPRAVLFVSANLDTSMAEGQTLTAQTLRRVAAAAADGKAPLSYPSEDKAGVAPLGGDLLQQQQQQRRQTQHPQEQQQQRQHARRRLQNQAANTTNADAGSEAVEGGGGGKDGAAADPVQAAVNGAGAADVGSAAVAQNGNTSPPPPLELAVMPDPQLPVSERCVFILGTGRSGSTALVDALNHLPHYLIRGEQKGAFWFLYQAWRALERVTHVQNEFQSLQRKAEERFGERSASRLTYDTVKKAYDTYAVQTKLPWFNDLHLVRLTDAARAFYAETYGYHGPGIVSGFKEIRFVCGQAFPSPGCRYSDFVKFLRFLRQLCTDVKLLLNSRSSHSAADNAKLIGMMPWASLLSPKCGTNDTASFEQDLATTHEWYDRYVQEHRSSAFRVVMEDMFDPQRNATLARQLLQFLGEDPAAHSISFTRMPTWSDPSGGGKKKSSKAKMHHREPWQIRRRRRRALAEAGAGAEGAAGDLGGGAGVGAGGVGGG